MIYCLTSSIVVASAMFSYAHLAKSNPSVVSRNAQRSPSDNPYSAISDKTSVASFMLITDVASYLIGVKKPLVLGVISDDTDVSETQRPSIFTGAGKSTVTIPLVGILPRRTSLISISAIALVR